MSNAQPDYYKMLGVSPEATPDEIKRQYRSLARKYHPDVNPSPDAAQRIKVINEAYNVLGDADRRATYDAHRLLSQRPPPPPPGSPPTDRTTRLRPEDIPESARTPRSTSRVGYNGFGTVPDASQRGSVRPTQRTTPAQAAEATRATAHFNAVDHLIKEAQLAFVNRQYKEAETYCHQALTIDRRNATAYEILADVCVKRGMQERARTYYSYAVQYNPRNVSAQAKLERMLGVRNTGPTIVTPAESSWERLAEGQHRDLVIYAFSVVLLIGFFGMCLLLKMHPGLPFLTSLAVMDGISFNLLGALAFNGIIGGILLALYGGMRPITDELLSRGSLHGDERTPVSLGAILTGFALIWFYASFLVYIGIAMARNRFSLSILRAYGLTLLLTVLFAFLYAPPNYPQGSIQAAAFAGNVLFPALLFGWAVGDALRLNRA